MPSPTQQWKISECSPTASFRAAAEQAKSAQDLGSSSDPESGDSSGEETDEDKQGWVSSAILTTTKRNVLPDLWLFQKLKGKKLTVHKGRAGEELKSHCNIYMCPEKYVLLATGSDQDENLDFCLRCAEVSALFGCAAPGSEIQVDGESGSRGSEQEVES